MQNTVNTFSIPNEDGTSVTYSVSQTSAIDNYMAWSNKNQPRPASQDFNWWCSVNLERAEDA